MSDRVHCSDKVWVLQALGGWYAAYQITWKDEIRTGLAAFRLRDAAMSFVLEHFEKKYHCYFAPRLVALADAMNMAKQHKDIKVRSIFYVEEYDYSSPAIIELPPRSYYASVGSDFLTLPPIDYSDLPSDSTE